MHFVFKAFLYLLALALILLIEIYDSDALFSWSLPIIKGIQNTQSVITRTRLIIFTKLGDGSLYFFIFLCLYYWCSHAMSLFYLMFLCICLALNNILKMMFHHPRPYFVDEDITPFDCSSEYGTPSGHCLYAAGISLFLFLQFYHTKAIDKQSEFNKIYYAMLGLAVLFALLMAYSRVSLGVHSVDQVILGLMLGIWIALFYHYCRRDFVFGTVNELQIKKKRVYAKNLLIWTAIYVLFMGMQIGAYLYVDSNFEVPEQWVQNVEELCGDSSKYGSFHARSLVTSGFITIAYGGYIGIQFYSWFFQSYDYEPILSIENFAGLLISILILASPVILIEMFAPIEDVESDYKKLLYFGILPNFYLGFAIYGLAYPFYQFLYAVEDFEVTGAMTRELQVEDFEETIDERVNRDDRRVPLLDNRP